MARFTEFAEILLEQLVKTAPQSPPKNLQWGVDWTPPTLLFCRQNLSEKHRDFLGKSAYRVTKRPSPPPPPLAPHLQAIVERWAQWGVPLELHFSEANLRQAWRRLAKKFHPDHGGEARHFQQARRDFLELRRHFSGQ